MNEVVYQKTYPLPEIDKINDVKLHGRIPELF